MPLNCFRFNIVFFKGETSTSLNITFLWPAIPILSALCIIIKGDFEPLQVIHKLHRAAFNLLMVFETNRRADYRSEKYQSKEEVLRKQVSLKMPVAASIEQDICAKGLGQHEV